MFFYNLDIRDTRRELCVLIPAYNEHLVIKNSIQSLIKTGLRLEDIYLLDDGSTDRTAETAKEFQINLIRNNVQMGKAESINRAIKEFEIPKKYRLMSLLDADTQVNIKYFEHIIKAFDDNPEAVVVCGQPKSLPHNWITAYRAYSYFVNHSVYKPGQSIMKVITVASGCATTFKTDLFKSLEWETDTLVEDMDITIQIHRKKLGKLFFEPRAITYTQDPRTIDDYIGQMNRWNTGMWQVIKKHRIPFGWTGLDAELALLLGEAMAYSGFMFLLPLWLFLKPSFVLWLLLMDQLTVISIVLWACLKEKRWDLLKYFPIFITVRYIDYGILLSTFWNTIIKQELSLEWFKPARYRTDSPKEG
ncbi:MAG: glycosyltransferase family 2 protein [bacterium]|nr:glycosyltransferase family 2 protein [bacterium]